MDFKLPSGSWCAQSPTLTPAPSRRAADTTWPLPARGFGLASLCHGMLWCGAVLGFPLRISQSLFLEERLLQLQPSVSDLELRACTVVKKHLFLPFYLENCRLHPGRAMLCARPWGSDMRPLLSPLASPSWSCVCFSFPLRVMLGMEKALEVLAQGPGWEARELWWRSASKGEKSHLQSKLWAQGSAQHLLTPRTALLFLISSNSGPLRSLFITRFGSEFTLAAL